MNLKLYTFNFDNIFCYIIVQLHNINVFICILVVNIFDISLPTATLLHLSQALTCFCDAVKSRLNDIKGLESTGLTPQAEKVKVHLKTVTLFCLKAVEDDSSLLECSARDLAFSMAQIYISELCTRIRK